MRETRFKQTDIGPIPMDWDVTILSDCFSFGNGYTPSKDVREYWEGGSLPWFRIEDIKANGHILYDSIQHVTPKAVKGRLFPKGSFIISTSATIGEYALIECESLSNQRFVYLIPNTNGKISSRFFLHHCCILSDWCKENTDAGSSFASVNMSRFREYLIPHPILFKEQEKIADALFDVDKLIESLGKLIEKKRMVKQGTMQQLLTGRRRLPGFSKPWVEKKLGEIVNIRRGQSLQSKDFKNGGIPVIAGGKTFAGYHAMPNVEKSSITISASGAYAGYVWYHNYPIFASDCSSITQDNNGTSLEFVYQCLKYLQTEIYKLQTGGAQPHIHPKDISPLTIYIPSTLAEQQAIAKVMTDMDNEIEALAKKRDKYVAIKDGMMQQLLTGKIRLI